MPDLCQNRLTVIGVKAQVRAFRNSRWDEALNALHCELMENSPRRWPRLVLLLDFEIEETRLKGLATAKAGKMASCEFNY